MFEDFRIDGYLTGSRYADGRTGFFPASRRFDLVNQAARHVYAQVFTDNEPLRRIFGTQKREVSAAVVEAIEGGE